MLNVKDCKVILLVLKGLSCILKMANKMKQLNPLAFKIEECGGLALIEGLTNHPNDKIYSLALNIVETYFTIIEVCIVPFFNSFKSLEVICFIFKGG